MKFKLEFAMDNAVFTTEDVSVEYAEVRRILEQASKESELMDSAIIKDINGNTIGKWEISQ